MSPEYAIDGMFSIKSDVFSFGVLVLEIVSGKRNRGFCHEQNQSSLNLLGYVSIISTSEPSEAVIVRKFYIAVKRKLKPLHKSHKHLLLSPIGFRMEPYGFLSVYK